MNILGREAGEQRQRNPLLIVFLQDSHLHLSELLKLVDARCDGLGVLAISRQPLVEEAIRIECYLCRPDCSVIAVVQEIVGCNAKKACAFISESCEKRAERNLHALQQRGFASGVVSNQEVDAWLKHHCEILKTPEIF